MTLTDDVVELAKPLSPEEVVAEAWYMDSTDEDQRKPHRQNPNVPAPPSVLQNVGVLSWKLDADAYENDPKLEAIRKVRNYTYQDIITVSPKMDAYEDKIKSFFEEHIHDDEEIRYILDGCGYFDVRDTDDQWVRIACRKGDMIVLPAGMYHRFTLDENNYIKAMRLFVGDPVWTPINRSPEADAHPARGEYLTAIAA